MNDRSTSGGFRDRKGTKGGSCTGNHPVFDRAAAIQEGYLRLSRAIGNGAIDPCKGSAESFLYGIRRNIDREFIRARRRDSQYRKDLLCKQSTLDAVAEVLHSERFNWTGDKLWS